MEIIDLASIPSIAAIVYFALYVYKIIVEKKGEQYIKIIPIIAGVLGIILALIAYFFIPGIVYAENIYMAILVGIVSGLSATGVNQIFKQMNK